MKQEDVVESLLEEVIDSLKPTLRNAEVALEIVRQRKAEPGDRSGTLLSDLIDDGRFTVRWNGAECRLGWTKLFRLFRRLARPANHYVSVATLMEQVWEDDRTEETAVRSAVRNLRRKLEAAGLAELARAIRGERGYYGLILDGAAPTDGCHREGTAPAPRRHSARRSRRSCNSPRRRSTWSRPRHLACRARRRSPWHRS